jgi:hypothetical protein
MDLRSINVGWAGRARGNGPYGSYGASSNATEEIVKVVLKAAVICLVHITRDARALGKEASVTRGRRGYPAKGMI